MTEYTRFGGLETLDQWVNWDPPTKRPRPSIKRPLPYETALANDPEHVGFVFTADDPYIGFDIDQTNPYTVELLWILEQAGAFIQRSPSGQGWHAIGQGKLDGSGINWSRQGVEVYDSGRYFTMPMDNDVRGSVDADVQRIVDAVESEYRAQGPKASAVQLDRDIPEGERNHELFRIGSSLRGQHGFAEEVVLAALLGTNAMHCKPPLPDEEVVLIARSVGRYPAEVQGPQEQASVDDFEDEEEFEAAPEIEGDEVWLWEGEPQPIDWLWDQWLPRGFVTCISGEPGISKSTLAMQIGVHVALGRPLFDGRVSTGTFQYLSVEDPPNVMWMRLNQMRAQVGAEMADFEGRLFLRSVMEEETVVAHVNEESRKLGRYINEIKRLCTKRSIDVLALDLVSDFWDGNPNADAQVKWFVRAVLGRLAREFDMAILAVMHRSNAALLQGRGVGGAVGWEGSFRSVLTLTADPDIEGVIQLARVKANYSPRTALRVRWTEGYLDETDVTDEERYADVVALVDEAATRRAGMAEPHPQGPGWCWLSDIEGWQRQQPRLKAASDAEVLDREQVNNEHRELRWAYSVRRAWDPLG